MAARRRIDPSPRPIERPPLDLVLNRDPKRHYVGVDPRSAEWGLDRYTQMLGYEMEAVRPGGPRFAFGRKLDDGQPVTNGYGLVLVSCPIEQQQAEFEAGQAQVSAVEKKIVKPGGVDALRGFRSGGGRVSFENETEEPYVEGA